MFSIDDLPKLAKEYIEKYPPNTGYTVAAAEAVYVAYKAGAFPDGTNVGVQFALQYDGNAMGGDLIEITEEQLPYLASYSLDKGADCMDFVRNIYLLLFDKNPGDYTEGAYQKNRDKEVAWDQRRPMDLLLFKLSSRNPHATHAALYIGDGLMLHTRSKSKPLQVTKDTLYSESSRTGTGVFRILTDEEYKSLIVKSGSSSTATNSVSTVVYTRLLKLQYTVKAKVNFRKGPSTQYDIIRTISKGQYVTYMGKTDDWIKARYNGKTGYIHKNYLSICARLTGEDVKAVQEVLKASSYYEGDIDAVYGPLTAAGVATYQEDNDLTVDAICGPITWSKLIR